MHNFTCLNYSPGKKNEPSYMILEEEALCKSMFTEHPRGWNWKFAPGQYVIWKHQKVVHFN